MYKQGEQTVGKTRGANWAKQGRKLLARQGKQTEGKTRQGEPTVGKTRGANCGQEKKTKQTLLSALTEADTVSFIANGAGRCVVNVQLDVGPYCDNQLRLCSTFLFAKQDTRESGEVLLFYCLA